MKPSLAFSRSILAAALLVSAAVSALAQDVTPETRNRVERALRSFEVKPLDRFPEWYDPKAEPFFRFVQISDIHWSPQVAPLLAAAMEFVGREVGPAFVAVTGDNSGNSAVEAQQRLKGILDSGLKCPWFIVRGDNWARNFSLVFGSTRYAFECGGVRFVFGGLDHDDEGEGIGRFNDETWGWLRREFSPEKPLSTVLFLHENVQPPVFVDAVKLDSLLEKSPCAAATFTGHIHYDLEFKAGRVFHVLAPGLGPHERHGFKVCAVHEKHIEVRTVEWENGAYTWTMKFQRIELPHPARKPSADPIENFRSLPAAETAFDMKAKDQTLVLILQFGAFAKRIGKAEEFARILKGEEPKKEGGDSGKGEGF